MRISIVCTRRRVADAIDTGVDVDAILRGGVDGGGEA
jgi:hypothetical protein